MCQPRNARRAVAGAAPGTAELLPSPSGAANWTAGLPTDNGHDSDQVFEFNGTQAVRVPDGLVSVSPEEPFTVSVWMRHGPFGRKKETILCSSDRTGQCRRRGVARRCPLEWPLEAGTLFLPQRAPRAGWFTSTAPHVAPRGAAVSSRWPPRSLDICSFYSVVWTMLLGKNPDAFVSKPGLGPAGDFI